MLYDDKMLSIKEACTIVGCSYSKGYKLAKANKFPFKSAVQIGSTWAISRSELYKALRMSVQPVGNEDVTT